MLGNLYFGMKIANLTKLNLSNFILWSFLIYIAAGSIKSTGFCFSEGRYLSDRELLERYVTASKIFNLDVDYLDEKTAKQINFPDCCKISNMPSGLKWHDVYLRPFIYGERLYGIYAYYLDESRLKTGHPEPAVEIISDIESCGKKSDIDLYTMNLKHEIYDKSDIQNKKKN